MTDDERERLAEIEAREKAATPGPWVAWAPASNPTNNWSGKAEIAGLPRLYVGVGSFENLAVVTFIAAARDDVAWLLALVRRQEAESLQIAREGRDVITDALLIELESLRAWKAEAIIILAEYGTIASDSPGSPGSSSVMNLKAELKTLRAALGREAGKGWHSPEEWKRLEAAAAALREAIVTETYGCTSREHQEWYDKKEAALASDAGKGWHSPEEWAELQAKAAAMRQALEWYRARVQWCFETKDMVTAGERALIDDAIDARSERDVAGKALASDAGSAMLAELERTKSEVEQLHVQLAGCMTAADGANSDPAKQGDYGWSPAYQRVLEIRIELERLRAENATAEARGAAAEREACAKLADAEAASNVAREVAESAARWAAEDVAKAIRARPAASRTRPPESHHLPPQS